MFSRSILATLIALAAYAAHAAEGDGDHVRVDLIAADATLAPGQTTWVGLRLRHEPHWHTYWINPGDSGLPTRLAWQLPPGFRAGDIAWPTPRRIVVGDLYNFGYEGDIVLPLPLSVPADAKAGDTAHLAVHAKWLVCREECIPGKAQLALDLPIGATVVRDTHTQASFTAAHNARPQTATWTGTAQLRGDRIEVALRGDDLPRSRDLDAFPRQQKIANNAPPKIATRGDDLVLQFARSDYFSALPERFDLLLRSGAHAWNVSVPFTVAPAAARSPSAQETSP